MAGQFTNDAVSCIFYVLRQENFYFFNLPIPTSSAMAPIAPSEAEFVLLQDSKASSVKG
jgi:hypothetical protein